MPAPVTYFASGLLLLAAATVQAQTSFSIGPEVGFTVSGASYSLDNNTQVIYRTGFQAGVQAVLQRGRLGIQPSLRFSQKGYHYHYGYSLYETDYQYRLNYLTLPLNLTYSLRADGQGLHLTAGPYVGLLLGGSYHQTENDRFGGGSGYHSYDGRILASNNPPFQPITGSNYGYDIYRRPLDWGLQAGFGYRLGPLLAQADFSFGLRNIIAPTGYYASSSDTYNRAAQFSLSYLFPLAK